MRGPDGALVLGPDGAPVAGPADPQYVGTGRTVFDNKGQVVKQYKPYFSSIPGFEDEAELVEQGVTPVMHYDPVGRLVRVDLPNGTFTTTALSPWSVESRDPNDNVAASTWRSERIGYAGADPTLIAERRAAELTDAHADTPTTVHLDSQGRAFLTVEHAGFTGGPPTPVLYETRLALDVVGNVLSVEDARGNTAETRVFGMLQQVLRTDSEDAGWRLGLTDVAGAAVRSWNERGFASRVEYDELRRPTQQFVTPPAAGETVVTRTVWGESLPSPATTNHRGQPYRIYDGAGELTNVAYDFKGNLLSQQRRVTVAYETTQDWSLLDAATPPTPANIATLADAELDTEVFTTAFEYDALNRVTSSTTPDDSETLSTFNEAGLLETVAVRIRGAATETTFVSDFDYDARGQRLRCVHGNGTVTSYEYDPRTFRLARLRLVRDADSAVLQDLRYTYDPVGNINQIRDGAQQTVYFDNAVVSPDQGFEYDPLYRLTHAEGREHASLTQPTHADLSFGPQPHPNDPSALRTYEQDYAWDEVGNIVQLQHAASGGNFTRQYAYAAAGNRLLRNSAPGESAEPFSHSYTYDAHGNMTSMPHLAAMAWDHADRLQHCDLGGGGDVWFVYDAAGNRVRKVQVNTSGSTVRERVYLGAWEVWRERSGTPLVLEQERQTLHLGDDRGKLALVETLTVDDGDPVATPNSIQRHQHGNHLGSASLELDAAAAVISYEEFHPFGTSSYAANDSGIEVSAKRYRYIGKERDEETGLYHLGARYYASWLARWTAADPIGLGDGVNRYAYVGGNALRLSDPSGKAGEGNIFARIGREVAAKAGEVARGVSAAARRAERSEKILDAVKGEATRQYEDALRSADAEGMAYQKAFAEKNGFFIGGRIASQFEPGGDGPRKVSDFESDLRMALRGSGGKSLEARTAIVQKRLDRAVASIDWRGDVAESVAAAGGWSSSVIAPRLGSTQVSTGTGAGAGGGGGGGGGGRPARSLYRAMTEAEHGSVPETGPTARTLGVRPGTDILVERGEVRPGTGGMSVSPDDPAGLPGHRRPPELGGTGKDPVWKIEEGDLGEKLRFRQDKPTHGVIEPVKPMKIEEFQEALAEIQNLWKKISHS